jgi:orotate phosphoribosyltransferase
VTEEDVLELLRRRGALLSGHFRLTSGRHSDTYVEKARVLEHPAEVAGLAAEIASRFDDVDVVVSPAVGALPLGFAVAAAAGARFVYAEREAGRMALRRGFHVSPGERALVVEDVITTGGSAAEVMGLLRDAGAHLLGVAALADRSTEALDFPLTALVRVEADSHDADSCPMCAAGQPLRSPGSRDL